MIHPKPLLSLLACPLVAGSCFAADAAASREGWYIGLFGGFGKSDSTSLRQQGEVFLAPPHQHPRLPIDADGRTGSSDLAFGGGHVGYEWDRWQLGSGWRLRPAAEFEGMYLGTNTPTGEMPVTPAFLGTQYVTIPMTAGVFLANAVFTIQTPYSEKVVPYVGAGIGVAVISIEGSDSANPGEPGINHFNSDPDASDSAFAVQLKAGVKIEIHPKVSLFLEYRYLSVDSTNYTFGATDYPWDVHLPTTSWDVDLGRMDYNLFLAGLQYRF